jgi:Na+/H+-translocating membrane pyrophosphatase
MKHPIIIGVILGADGVVGDTVGDPMKDAAGPSLNILIKLMSMVSIVFAALVIRFAILR